MENSGSIYVFPSSDERDKGNSDRTTTTGASTSATMSEDGYKRGHTRSASHAPVGPGPPLVSAMKQGHNRAQSHGQIIKDEAHMGHRRNSSRTDFVLPPGHQDKLTGRGHHRQVSRTVSGEGHRRGHNRQASNAESVYTIRKFKVPLVNKLMFWKKPSPPDNRSRRVVVPNHDKLHIPWTEHPNRSYVPNIVSTTKYSFLTFLPRNLWEQFHRFANLYFLFIVFLNWFPAINAFGKELAMIPVLFVLGVTGVKDAYEDYRRHKSDKRVNNSTCLIFDGEKRCYKTGTWSQVRVGDIIKLHCNEIIPADMVLLQSSDVSGTCYIDTRNLDGESNLKQRVVPREFKDQVGQFSAEEFHSSIECEQPTTKIYQFHGTMLLSTNDRIPIGTENLLLRNCVIKNMDFVEGFVVYAGSDSKAMLNHGGQRYKRSSLEQRMNTDVIWCVLILIVLCIIGAVGSGLWLSQYLSDYSRVPFVILDAAKTEKGLEKTPGTDPNAAYQAFLSFWTFVVVLQVMIPISLYVTIELTKIAQIHFIHQDPDMVDQLTGKQAECRALNITEELAQIEYVFSDKTGTLTENNMIFRRCFINGKDYNHPPRKSEAKLVGDERPKICPNHHLLNEIQSAESQLFRSRSNISVEFRNHPSRIVDFFTALAVCNTVVVAKGAYQGPAFDPDEASKLVHTLLPIEEIFDPPNLVSQSSELSTLSERTDYELPSIASQPSDISIGSVDSAGSATSRKALVANDIAKPRRRLPLVPFRKVTFPKMPKLSSRQSEFEGSRSLSPIYSDPGSADYSRRVRPWSLFSNSSYTLPFRDESSPSPMPSPLDEIEPIVYEAESPDELALVDAAVGYNVKLVNRTPKTVTVRRNDDTYVDFEILSVLPFDSNRKRMSVVLRDPTLGKIVLYTKGADSAMFPNLAVGRAIDQQIISKSQQQIDNYAKLGLRTLVIGRRTLTETEYFDWAKRNRDAETAIDCRDRLLLESHSRIEKNLELLGATAIEDKLQDGVPETIHSLRKAGIVVWVLTGDKQETAINIAYSCSLFSEEMEILVIAGRGKDGVAASIRSHLENIRKEDKESSHESSSSVGYQSGATDSPFHVSAVPKRPSSRGLVVEGKFLTFILDERSQLQREFLELTQQCSSVLCCRTTPLQKAVLVKIVKQKLKKRTLAVGDGANDVSMIQTADVGVGISGVEGMQAVMASDFAVPKFRMLKKLLLVHGHWSYDRLARMVQYFFYKNTNFVLVLFWYQFYCGFTATSMMDQLYLLLFSLFFTSLPPMALGILDEDAPADLLLSRPDLYSLGRECRAYKSRHYWINFADAVYQSLVMYFTAHFAYEGSDVDIWEFGTYIITACVFVQNLHLAMDFKCWTVVHLGSILVSIISFFAFAFVYSAVCNDCYGVPNPYWVTHVAMGRALFWTTLVLTCILSLLPRLVFKAIWSTCFPDDVEKALFEHKKISKKSPETFSEMKVIRSPPGV